MGEKRRVVRKKHISNIISFTQTKLSKVCMCTYTFHSPDAASSSFNLAISAVAISNERRTLKSALLVCASRAARYFLTPASFPARSSSWRCVTCLNLFVSIMDKVEGAPGAGVPIESTHEYLQ